MMEAKRSRTKAERRAIPLGFVMGAVGLVLLVLILGVVHLRLQQSNHDLGEKLRASEFELRNIQETNAVLYKELGVMRMPENVLKRAQSMGLELNTVTVTQIVRVPEVEVNLPGGGEEGGR